MKIKVGFSSSNKILSRLIRWFSGSLWSHCFLVVGEIAGHEIIGEARPPYVRLIHIDDIFRRSNKINFIEIEVDDELHKSALHELLKLTGKSYGFFQLIGFLWPLLMQKLGYRRINPFFDGIVCSEYVGYYLQKVNIIDLFVNVNQLTPDDIFQFVITYSSRV